YKGRDVLTTIKKSFPNSAKVGAVSIVFSVGVGVLLGIIAALKADKWPDRVCMLLATLGITIPSFVMGTFLIYIFTVQIKGFLPATGLSKPKNYIMPVIALSGSSMAFITRLTRSKLIDVLKSDYIRTAKAKGLSGKTI
ncbi:ABC transporter permease subunit, partial [Clostridium perfringens]|nr:ABC transporter permease subunit [Clostridium perfringens]